MGKKPGQWTPPEDAVQVETATPELTSWTPPEDAVPVKKKDETVSQVSASGWTPPADAVGAGASPGPSEPSVKPTPKGKQGVWSPAVNFLKTLIDIPVSTAKTAWGTLVDQVPSEFKTEDLRNAKGSMEMAIMPHTNLNSSGFESSIITPAIKNEFNQWNNRQGTAVRFKPDAEKAKMFLEEKFGADYQTKQTEFNKELVSYRLGLEEQIQAQQKEYSEKLGDTPQDVSQVTTENVGKFIGNLAGQAIGRIPTSIASVGSAAIIAERAAVFNEQLDKMSVKLGIPRKEIIKRGLDNPESGRVLADFLALTDIASIGNIIGSAGKKVVRRAASVGGEALQELFQGEGEAYGGAKGAGVPYEMDTNRMTTGALGGLVGGTIFSSLSPSEQTVKQPPGDLGTPPPPTPSETIQTEKAKIASTGDMQAVTKAADVIQQAVNSDEGPVTNVVPIPPTAVPTPTTQVQSIVPEPTPQGTEADIQITKETPLFHTSVRKRSGRLLPNVANGLGEGVYFATDREGASAERGENVTQATVDLKNPVRTGSQEWQKIEKLALEKAAAANPKNKGLVPSDEEYKQPWRHDIDEIDSKFISDAAKELGHDAIINKNDQYGQEVLVLDESKITYTEDALHPTQKVFVYGTLQDTEVRREALGTGVDATPATIPGMQKEEGKFSTIQKGKGEVKGQMIDVTPEQMAKLDKWEKNYERKEIQPGVFAYVRKEGITPEGKKARGVSLEEAQIAKEYNEEVKNPKIDPKDAAIASVIGKVNIGKYGDANMVSRGMARSYMAKAGTPIDVVAQTASKGGLEVTPDDVWDFMLRYPNGPGTITQPSGNPRLQALNERYIELTGKGLNRKTASELAKFATETLGSDKAIAESSKLIDAQTGEVRINAIIDEMESDPEGYMAKWGIDQETYDHQLNTAYHDREKQGPPNEGDREDGGTPGTRQETRRQGGPLSSGFRDASKDPASVAEEISAKPLTHVQGLNMGKGLASGTYLSTEGENRYAGAPKSATVTIKNPFVFLNENLIIPFRNKILRKNLDSFKPDDFENQTDFPTLEDLSMQGVDKLADLVRAELQKEGFDSIYLPETETQEGELIVFDKENVKIEGEQTQEGTPSTPTTKGPYQLEAEARVAKAQETVNRAQAAHDEKKATLGKSLKQDQIDIFGNRIGDAGKMFQEGAGDRAAAKKQLDTIQATINEATANLEKAKEAVAQAIEADKNDLFQQQEEKRQVTKAHDIQSKVQPTSVSVIEQQREEELFRTNKPEKELNYITDQKIMDKQIQEEVIDDDGNTDMRTITVGKKQSEIKKEMTKLKNLMDCIYG